MLWCPLVIFKWNWISFVCVYTKKMDLYDTDSLSFDICSLSFTKAMAGQIVMRWLKDMSRKQMVGSQWSCKRKKFSHLMTTFWSCVWTPTQGTHGLLSSGSTASNAAFLVILRRTITTRRSAQVNKEPEAVQMISIWVCKLSVTFNISFK